MKFNECPYCGAHLDFGEACDCKAQGQEGGQRAAKGFRTALSRGSL